MYNQMHDTHFQNIIDDFGDLFTRPLFLPIHKRFYLSKCQVDGTLHKVHSGYFAEHTNISKSFTGLEQNWTCQLDVNIYGNQLWNVKKFPMTSYKYLFSNALRKFKENPLLN